MEEDCCRRIDLINLKLDLINLEFELLLKQISLMRLPDSFFGE